MTYVFQSQGPIELSRLAAIGKTTEKGQIAPTPQDPIIAKGPMTVLNQSLADSILGNTAPQSLESKGFAKGKGPLDGAIYYRNPNTGEIIRVQTNRENNKKCYEYQNGNMQHSVIYDKNGKALGGDLQIKQKDGTLTLIRYELDEKGNKIITEVETLNQDGFCNHDGQF